LPVLGGEKEAKNEASQPNDECQSFSGLKLDYCADQCGIPRVPSKEMEALLECMVNALISSAELPNEFNRSALIKRWRHSELDLSSFERAARREVYPLLPRSIWQTLSQCVSKIQLSKQEKTINEFEKNRTSLKEHGLSGIHNARPFTLYIV